MAPRLRHWSIRARLTSVFVLASVVVVLAVSVLLLRDQQSNSSARLDRQLVERIDAVELSIRKHNRFPYSELYGEVIDADYRILGMSNAVELPGLLTQSQADFVLRNGSLAFTRRDEALGGMARFLAQRRTIGSTPLVVVVGSAEDTLHDAHRRLLLTLVFGAPFLVVLFGVGGWALSGGVLRPVRRMAADAKAISQFDSSARLAVPARHDELWYLSTTLNEMLGRLEDSYHRERAFVDDASHELRTPLSVLRGELELAALRPGDREATAASLQRAIGEVDRLAALTSDLLVLARAHREPSAATDAVVVGTVARDVVERYARSIPEGIRVDVADDASGAAARIRPDALERIVRNLLDNAARFAASSVAVRVTSTADQVELRVTDDGPGFPDAFLPRAFERFSVASDARTRREGGGTGLGLAIVRALTEEADGRATASNAEPHGGQVAVTLPRALIEPSPAARDNSEHE